MLRTLLMSLILIFSIPSLAIAEITKEDNNAIDLKIDTFFKDLNAGHTDQAYNAIFVSRVQDKKTEMENLAAQTNYVLKVIGTPVKWEMSSQSTTTNVLVYRRYVVYGTEIPESFDFIMFKTSKGWLAFNISFRDIDTTIFP